MRNVVTISLILVIIALVGFIALRNDGSPISSTNNQQSTSSSQTDSSETVETQTDPGSEVTLSELALHGSESDCWTLIGGNIYDITSYLPLHPGGDEILLSCGGDGTALFTQRMTSDGQSIGSGTPHSNNAASIISDLYIGALAQ